jgi:hypothetical protein
MSIYRKTHVRTPDEIVKSIMAPAKGNPALPARPDPQREEAEKRKRGKGQMGNEPLPLTLAWASALPADVRPDNLMRSFGRIANVLARDWDQREATYAYFDRLLVDQRGNRKGFSPEVTIELVVLREYYEELHLQSSDAWQSVTKK